VTKRFYGQGEQISGVAYYSTRDHLGSVQELLDGTGSLAAGGLHARYSYDVYGQRSANLVTLNPVESDFGFTGHQEFDAIGLLGAPLRFYQPSFARWLSRDPIKEAGGLNLYQYVGNLPTTMIDPLALDRYITTGASPVPGHQGLAVDTWAQQNGAWVVTGQRCFDYGANSMILGALSFLLPVASPTTVSNACLATRLQMGDPTGASRYCGGSAVSAALARKLRQLEKMAISKTCPLLLRPGTFSYSYDGVSARLTGVAYPNGQTTQYGYFGASGSRRLQQIQNLDANSAVISQVNYSYKAVGDKNNKPRCDEIPKMLRGK
jgi:RHS repeat-associated protein